MWCGAISLAKPSIFVHMWNSCLKVSKECPKAKFIGLAAEISSRRVAKIPFRNSYHTSPKIGAPREPVSLSLRPFNLELEKSIPPQVNCILSVNSSVLMKVPKQEGFAVYACSKRDFRLNFEDQVSPFDSIMPWCYALKTFPGHWPSKHGQHFQTIGNLPSGFQK